MLDTRRERLIAMLLGVALVTSIACAKRQVSLQPTPLVPAASGSLDVGKDDNGNTTVELKVKHLARPAQLTPPRNAYVVWTQRPGAPARNEGQLTVGDDLDGEFRTVTALRNFDVFITAENSPTAQQPSGPVVFRSTVRPD